MKNELIKLKIKNRLNRLDSDDSENIPDWQLAEAFNKEQREWVRRQARGFNQAKEGKEESVFTQADLQQILTTFTGSFTDKGLYWESTGFPSDYLVFARVSANAVADCCPPRSLTVFLGQESDVDIALHEIGRAPSFKWRTTFYTLFGNHIRIYTNGLFAIDSPSVTYYRSPRSIVFANSTNTETGVFSTVDIESEFKDEIVELIISGAADILAGDIESQAQMQRNRNNADRNT